MTGCPPISGREADIAAVMLTPRHVWASSAIDLEQLRSGFACALHMHQPTVPAGANNSLISHLQYMLDHPNEVTTTTQSHSPTAIGVLPTCCLN